MKEVLFCKKNLIFTLIYLIFAVGILFFVSNDAFLYKESVAKVIKTHKVGSYKKKSQNMHSEKYKIQELKIKVLNGKYKGQEFDITNDYSTSEVKTMRYVKGDKIFVAFSNDMTVNITGEKRDTIVVGLALFFVYIMILVSGLRGIAFVLASVINVGLLYVALDMYAKGTDIMNICLVLIVLYTVISLTCVIGFNKATPISIFSVFIVVALVGIIYKMVLNNVEPPDYAMLEYVGGPNDLDKIFFMEVLIGCLGAVMDVSVSVSETARVLKQDTPSLSTRAFIKSMREVGADVTGTMINILFYSYFCGSVPMILIQMKNKYKLNYIFRFDLPFELTRFLTGSIGIILTIPVTAFVAWLILFKVVRKRGCEN